MDYDFIFKRGQYRGQTVAWVEEKDPGYLVWVEECKPEMLKDNKPIVKQPEPYREPENDTVESAIKPNLNFYDNKNNKNN